MTEKVGSAALARCSKLKMGARIGRKSPDNDLAGGAPFAFGGRVPGLRDFVASRNFEGSSNPIENHRETEGGPGAGWAPGSWVAVSVFLGLTIFP
jgi:hypothetical protein